MIKEMFELRSSGVVKVPDDNLTCDPSCSVIDSIRVANKKNEKKFQGFFATKSRPFPGDLSPSGMPNVNEKAEYMQCYCIIQYR